MSIVKERIVLRRHRRAGERIPRRIVLDKLETGDSLLVEIVIDRQKDLVKCYLFDPKRLEGRRNVTFRVSGEEVYWLGGASPKPLLHQQAERMFAEQKQSEKSKHGGSQSGRRPRSSNVDLRQGRQPHGNLSLVDSGSTPRKLEARGHRQVVS